MAGLSQPGGVPTLPLHPAHAPSSCTGAATFWLASPAPQGTPGMCQYLGRERTATLLCAPRAPRANTCSLDAACGFRDKHNDHLGKTGQGDKGTRGFIGHSRDTKQSRTSSMKYKIHGSQWTAVLTWAMQEPPANIRGQGWEAWVPPRAIQLAPWVSASSHRAAPAKVPGKAVEDSPRVWVPATHAGDPARVPSSGSSLAQPNHNHAGSEPASRRCLSLCHSVFQMHQQSVYLEPEQSRRKGREDAIG